MPINRKLTNSQGANRMFTSMKLSTKLIGGFVVVAVITLIVGFFGWKGITDTSEDLKDITGTRVPGLMALAEIQEEQMSIHKVERSQAEQMKVIAGELQGIVGGSIARAAGSSSAPAASGVIQKALSFKNMVRKSPDQGGAPGSGKNILPESVIPLDDKDFKNFQAIFRSIRGNHYPLDKKETPPPGGVFLLFAHWSPVTDH
jgi:hypothetical protein